MRPAAITIFTDPAGPRPGQAQHLSSLTATASAARSSDAGDRGRSSLYVGDPTIPEGMTCAEWRQRFPRPPAPTWWQVLTHPIRWLVFQTDPRRYS